ncbi:unnamed protein product [Arctogadus glacialis]
MLLRHGSLPLLLLLWLASAQGATLATLYRAQAEANPSAEPAADPAGLPAVEAPAADAALNDPAAADALAGRRPDAGSAAPGALTESTEATEPQPEAAAAREPLSNSIEAEEPQTDSGDAKDPVSNSIDAQEPQPDSTEAPQPVPETGGAKEPLPESGGPQEPLPETEGPQEPLPETEGPQEPLPESGGPQDPLPETEGPQEPLPEAEGPQDPLPESGVSQDPTPDTLVADGDVETEATQSGSTQAQDPEELSPPAADLPDDSDAPDLSAQETLPEEEEEWAGVPGNTELQTGKEAEDSGGWGLSGLRGSFQTINGYFDSMVELVGGRNGVCQYRCRHGSIPQPRPDYQIPEPDGCTSSLIGMQVEGPFDLGIPAMTQCCDKLDQCYDTCGSSKSRCDSKFRWCLHSLCTDLKTSLGFVSKVEACESGADALYNTVSTLGCRPYMNSQREACVCTEEDREEL